MVIEFQTYSFCFSNVFQSFASIWQAFLPAIILGKYFWFILNKHICTSILIKKLNNHGYFSLQADSWGSQIAFGQPHFLDSLSTRFFHRESVAITFITQLLNWIPYQVEWSPPNLNWNSCIVGCNLYIYGRYFRNFLQIKITPLQCKCSELN